MAKRTRISELPVFIGIRGIVVALERGSGAELWRMTLKGQGFVNLTLDNGLLLASTRGEVWCIEPSSGALLWQNPLKGLGWGFATFATATSSQQSVTAAVQQQQEQAAAASATSAAG